MNIRARSLLNPFLALAFILPALPAARAQVTIYATGTDNGLYAVNPSTQAATLIGSTGVGFLEGLAISPAGILYGTSSNGLLYSLSTTTGAATLIGDTGRGNIEGLEFNDSTLLGITFGSASPTIFSINPATATTTNLVSLSLSSTYVRAMVTVDSNTVLLAVDGSPSSLYSVNLTTGAATALGSLAVHGSQFAAMDSSATGALYGLDNDGTVWSINPATAAVTLLGNTGGQFWLDMTVQAIPEPSSWALLLVGTAGLGLAARRRRR